MTYVRIEIAEGEDRMILEKEVEDEIERTFSGEVIGTHKPDAAAILRELTERMHFVIDAQRLR